MFKRKAYQRLLDWKAATQGQSVLLIEGARRVGKSTLVEDFGRREYRSSLLIDFSTAANDVKELFETKRDNIESFFSYLIAYYNVNLYTRDSLIVFDEIQFCPAARGFLKQLVKDGRYDYIETGSLISIKQNTENILIPSEEEPLALHPLDFEEFCWALGEEVLVTVMSAAANTLEPLPEALHRKCMGLFREYMLVGGMPQAVEAYAKNRDFSEVDKVKRRILNLYRNDVAKFAKGYESKVISIFEDIPSQLAKREKRFNLAALGKNVRMRTYEDAFFWLADAGITTMCYNASDPNVGLGMNLDRPTFKCFMADTGLLVSQAFASNQETPHKFYRDVLFDRLEINEGMLMENVVAQQLTAAGRKLFFYSRSNREDSTETIEIDFLIIAQGAKPKVCPLEVKSTVGYATASLGKFKEKFGKRIGTQYILHTRNIKTSGGRVYLPLYLALWL
jgi:predicted AAA+ superfamily ATPase